MLMTIHPLNIGKIKVKAHDKTIFVTIEDIEYLESMDGKVYINLGSQKLVMETTLQGFDQLHRSMVSTAATALI